jgi:hypothetical protein
VGSAAQSWVAASGELWTEPVRLRLEPDEAEGDRWAALIFGTDDHTLFSEAQMMALALRGGAVSPVTSYLAIEPGVRPSTDGLEPGRLGGNRRARAPRVRMGATNVRGAEPAFDPQDWLTQELAALWLGCTGGGVRARIDLETTLAEVVEVDEATAPGADDAQRACLREAAWGMALPPQFEDEHQKWSVKI